VIKSVFFQWRLVLVGEISNNEIFVLVRLNLSLYLTKHNAIKRTGGMEV